MAAIDTFAIFAGLLCVTECLVKDPRRYMLDDMTKGSAIDVWFESLSGPGCKMKLYLSLQ